LIHRDGDLPAVVCSGGYQAWVKHNKKHRDGDLPARVWPCGCSEWYKDDLLHRDDDLPAVMRCDKHGLYKSSLWKWYRYGVKQTVVDSERKRQGMLRWTPLRAAFVGAVAAAAGS
jgi:hypothetical protein